MPSAPQLNRPPLSGQVIMWTLLTDNWTLEEVAGCLAEGLSEEGSRSLHVDVDADSHSWLAIPGAAHQVDALLALLTDIVLSDQLIVDAADSGGWKYLSAQLRSLAKEGIIVERELRWDAGEHCDERLALITHLCATESLRDAAQFFWQDRPVRQSTDQRSMSIVVWGTAGYLIRGGAWEMPYAAHPARKHLISQTALSSHPNARETVTEWIRAERSRLFEAVSDSLDRRQVELNLPPIAVEVIEASADPDKLLSTAVQLRDKYKKYRGWLAEYQDALQERDPRALLKHKRVLKSVAKRIDREVSGSRFGFTTVKLGVGWVTAPIPLPYVRPVRHRFGIRGMLSRQVFSKSGESSLQKLLGLFGHKRTKLGRKVEEYLMAEGQITSR